MAQSESSNGTSAMASEPGAAPLERKAPTVNDIVAAMVTMGLSLGYDELAAEPTKTGLLPWDRTVGCRPWDELDDAELFALLQEVIGLRSERALACATTIYSRRHAYDPLKAMLDDIVWDGAERAGTLLTRYLGVEPTPYSAAVERIFFCGGIARAYSPGCKFDYVLTLVGPGGLGKSTFARRLALCDRFFCDSVYDLGNVKTTGETLRGKWIIELAELTGISGRSLEAVKAGVTRQTDTFRVAYGKRSTDFPRRSVFIATTNTVGFISEKSSGARRFLPVLCGSIPPEGSVFSREFAEDARQAWAEVRAWHAADDPHFTLALDREMEVEAARQREGFLEDDPRVEAVNEYLAANRDHPVCTRELADRALRVEPTAKLYKDLSAILTDQCPGWRYDGKRHCGPYKKQRCWVYRPE